MYNLTSNNIPNWLIIGSTVFVAIICVANLMVILAFIIQHTIRKPQHYFLASLAVSDFMVGLISMPFFLQFIYLDRWVLGRWVCQAWLILDFTACMASKMGVFLITTDRFLLFTFPWTYTDYQTKRNVSIVIAIVWTFAIVIFTTAIAGWHGLVDDGKMHEEGSCHVLFMEDRVFTLMWAVGYYWIPLVYMCVLYRRIYITALFMHRSSGSRNTMWHSSNQMGTSQNEGTSCEHTLTHKLQLPKNNSFKSRTQKVTFSGSDKNDNLKTDLSGQGLCAGSTKDSCLVSDTAVKDVDNTGIVNKLTNLEINSESTLCKDENKSENRSSMAKKPAFFLPLTDTNGKVTKAYDDFVTNEKSKPAPEESVMNGKVTGKKMINWKAAITHENVITNGKATKTTKRLVTNETSKPAPEESMNGNAIQDPDKAVTIGKAALTHKKETVTNGLATKPLQELVTNENSKPAHDEANKTDVTAPSVVGDVTTLKDQCACGADDDGLEGTSRSPVNYADVKINAKKVCKFESMRWIIDWNHEQKQIYKNHVRRSLKAITLILGAFLISWTPYNVVVFTRTVGWYENVNTTFYTVTYWLCYLNSAVNPLCYALANPEFRRTFIRIFKLDWHIA
ncbi:muscarinic acetylcholine receptor M4-like [Gigantopelta aegis]|uniref:muscarinic acetylcholine receptor M4-like n=1 Tax=Gigantopelta aegis TaxID=1735272 RepID=UPI001B889A59|nr:muscarinic acetylcholine receptor M4-like [Gigantopelta aegis]